MNEEELKEKLYTDLAHAGTQTQVDLIREKLRVLEK